MNRWIALAAVSLGTFMTYLDNNIVNVALPSIQKDLGLTISGLEWIVSSYVLVFAGLLLAGGRIADVFGVRRVFLGGLAIFTLASLAAGLVDSQELLITARVVQGIGAALLTPASLSVISAMFPTPKERATAIGIWSGVSALALALGPLTGGLLSQHADWGWIFLINVPFGLVTGLLAVRHLPVSAGTRRAVDVPGLLTSSVALFAVTYALIEGESQGWSSPLILGVFTLSAVAFAFFVLIESRSADPMIALSLFRRPLFSGGLLAMGLWSFGVFGIYFYLTLYLQNVLGFSPTEAGAAFVPLALLLAVMAGISPGIAARFGAARTVALGLAMMAGAVGGLAFPGPDSGYLQLLPWFLLYGAGAGLLVPLTDVIIGALAKEEAGVASGMLNVSREVFGLLGITVLGAILSARQTAPTPQAFLDAYQFTLLVAAAIVALGVPLSLIALRTPRRSHTAQPDLVTVA